MSRLVTVYPAVFNGLLTNPGIGFTAAPGLMNDPEVVQDPMGVRHAPYKFSEMTSNHPDSKVYFFSVRWRDVEEKKGIYCWEVIEEKLQAAKSLGCTAIVRCSPYALNKEDDIPEWSARIIRMNPCFPSGE